MEFVVDTNVLFSFFWKGSPTKELLKKHKLISPEVALDEINKYKSVILSKTGLSSDEFKKLKEELALIVDFIPLEEYSDSLKEAEKLSNSFSENEKQEFLNDLDFFALSLKSDLPIWSNDKLFKKQPLIDVLTTSEIVSLFGFET
ncbi:MAG: PIN domain-containing protein [archaeon]